MGGIFHPESKLVRFMTLVTNLVCLNALWIIGCIPVITAGASTAAMYSVLFRYLTGKDDAVWKPFWRAFGESFRQVTPFWVMHLLVSLAFGAGVLYMTLDVEMWVRIVFGAMLLIYAAAGVYCYPIFARFNTTWRAVLLNSFALTFRHLLSSLSMAIISALPLGLLLLAPEIFWKTILVWTLVGFSILAYLNAKILLPIFRQYEDKEDEEEI